MRGCLASGRGASARTSTSFVLRKGKAASLWPSSVRPQLRVRQIALSYLFHPLASSELTAGRGHRCRVSVRQARTVRSRQASLSCARVSRGGGGGRDAAVTVRTKEMVGGVKQAGGLAFVML